MRDIYSRYKSNPETLKEVYRNNFASRKINEDKIEKASNSDILQDVRMSDYLSRLMSD